MGFALGIVALLLAIVVFDTLQRKHTILRNFPVVGHLRYLLEMIGPELRQYIVTGNDEERPFTRDQRRWIYASSKKENTYFGFGTDNELELSSNYLILKHSAFPLATSTAPDSRHSVGVAKVLGGARGRRHAFRPSSIVSVSGMSFGSLSGSAIHALNAGCAIAGCLQNTGEGGISPHHLHGGELIFQMGTGYFGCRDDDGRFSLPRLVDLTAAHPVRAIEIKLSQGAKPGLGGVLPAAKVTPEIARIRGVPLGQDCISPSAHEVFASTDEMLDFVETIADATGLPVGIKAAVGDLGFWQDLVHLMARGDRGIDFVAIDGGEGGTGAAPLAFCDHVALPFKVAFSRVYRLFAAEDLHEQVVFAGAGKLGLPESALLAFALGCDMVNVAREVMLSIGCIQAQRCHLGHCPAGIATQSRWLGHGLDPTTKAVRAANYISALRKEMLRLCHALGLPHPAYVTSDDFEILDGRFGTASPRELFEYEPGWGRPSEDDLAYLDRESSLRST